VAGLRFAGYDSLASRRRLFAGRPLFSAELHQGSLIDEKGTS
jgi:hypothetical protein